MRGRKPKPTHLKVLAGNPGRRPLNKSEPKPEGDLFDAPEWMTESQRAGWAYAIANAPGGLLKMLDRSTLTIWVVAEDLHRQASEAVAKLGILIKSPVKGEPMQNPYVAVLNKQAAIMLKASAELGFTPASRSRISMGATGAQDDNPFTEFG